MVKKSREVGIGWRIQNLRMGQIREDEREVNITGVEKFTIHRHMWVWVCNYCKSVIYRTIIFHDCFICGSEDD